MTAVPLICATATESSRVVSRHRLSLNTHVPRLDTRAAGTRPRASRRLPRTDTISRPGGSTTRRPTPMTAVSLLTGTKIALPIRVFAAVTALREPRALAPSALVPTTLVPTAPRAPVATVPTVPTRPIVPMVPVPIGPVTTGPTGPAAPPIVPTVPMPPTGGRTGTRITTAYHADGSGSVLGCC